MVGTVIVEVVLTKIGLGEKDADSKQVVPAGHWYRVMGSEYPGQVEGWLEIAPATYVAVSPSTTVRAGGPACTMNTGVRHGVGVNVDVGEYVGVGVGDTGSIMLPSKCNPYGTLANTGLAFGTVCR